MDIKLFKERFWDWKFTICDITLNDNKGLHKLSWSCCFTIGAIENFTNIGNFSSTKYLFYASAKSKYSLVPNITHRSIETHACTLVKSIWLNYPHAWTNGKLLCGKKHTTNNFVLHNPIKTHEFKISTCQNMISN